MTEENRLRAKLVELEREYRTKAEPYIAALCEIEARKPMPPFILEAALASKPIAGVVIEEIAAERQRQITVEGWVPEHDAEHGHGELAAAAACFALSGSLSEADRDGSIRGCHPLGRSVVEVAETIKVLWPWDWKWWKPKGQRRDLVRAGALIVAEIERMDRSAGKIEPAKPSPIAAPDEAELREILEEEIAKRGRSPSSWSFDDFESAIAAMSRVRIWLVLARRTP